MQKYHITLVESPEGWAVWCDDLPGCASQGQTREEALENIRIALREVLEVQAELRAAQEADFESEGLRVEHTELGYA